MIDWQNLHPDIAKAIKDAMKSGVAFEQATLHATQVGQRVWELPWDDFVVGMDLLLVTNNTATLHDDMYTVTKNGAKTIITIVGDYIPADLPIVDNDLFLTTAKGVKYENGAITTVLAKNVVFEPVAGLPQTNVQEAIEQVFVYAKEIIKTVADSLGNPFKATDTNLEMKTKLTELMAKFRVNLERKNVTLETENTIYELVDKIVEIDTGFMKSTDYEAVTAPFDWVIDLQNKRKSADLLVTVIENMPPVSKNELYSCLFNAEDASRFEPNPNVEFTDNVHLLNHHDYDLTLDTSFVNTYKKHFLTMNQSTVGDIDEMLIKEKNDTDIIQWIHINMVGIDAPSPYRARASSVDGVNQPWKAFSDDSRWWGSVKKTSGNTREEWIKFDFGAEFPYKAVAVEGIKPVRQIDVYLSNNESDFLSNNTTGTWNLTGTNENVNTNNFDYIMFPNVVSARYLMVKYTRYSAGVNTEKQITASTVALGRLM